MSDQRSPDDKFSRAHGQIDLPTSIQKLHLLMTSAGLRCEVRESVHYDGGRYLMFRFKECDIIVEDTSEYGLMLSAYSDSPIDLESAAVLFSDALKSCEVRHRIELSDAEGKELGFLHHSWPSNEP